MKAKLNIYWLEKDDPTIQTDYESDDDFDDNDESDSDEEYYDQR